MNNTMLPRYISCLTWFSRRCMIMIAIGTGIAFSSFAQQKNELYRLQEILQSYSCASAQQERLFVFLNSGFFYPGESLSFNAVLFDANMKIKADGSRFFYLQLISYSGNSIGNYTYELLSGECSGQIRLPDTLQTGLYTLKAYTRWMQNFDPDNSFQRPLLVVSPLSGTLLSTSCDSIPLQFYPEGGNFILGTENTILVRLNPYSPVFIRQLNILDDLGKNLLTCSLDTNGVGVFSLAPELGRTYYAVFPDSGEADQIYKLPDPQYYGYCMNIREEKNLIHISVACAPETASNAYIYLAVLTRDADRSFIRQVNMVNNRGTLSIPSLDMTTGPNQILLFGNNAVLCSRLWYRKNESVAWQENILTDTLKTRESTICTNYLPEGLHPGNILAVSVNEYNPVTDSLFFNEISYCRYFDLYSSILHPEVLPLFEASDKEKYINDCLIALTKTLPMDYILHSRDKKLYSREKHGLMLTGKVESPVTRSPVKRAAVLLSYPDSVAHVNYSITNELGEFSFALNERLYNKQLYLIAQGYPKNSNPVTIIPDDPFRITSSGMEAFPLNHTAVVRTINSHQNIAMAYKVFYRTNHQPEGPTYRKDSSYHKDFYGEPDYTLITAEYEFLPDIFEIRKNLIPQLRLKLADDYCTMTVFDDYLQLFHAQQAFVLLNNIPYPSLKNVLELNSDIIRSITIKNSKYFYDNYLMYGIVAINTVKPVAIDPYYSNHVTTVNVNLDADEKSSIPIIHEGTLPDLRHSLYWSFGRKLPADVAGIQFRTSDIKGKYQLKAFYMDNDGLFRCTEKAITVL